MSLVIREKGFGKQYYKKMEKSKVTDKWPDLRQ